MCGGCLECVGRLSSGCGEVVCWVWTDCLEGVGMYLLGVGRLSGVCGDAVGRLPGECGEAV